MMKFIKALSIVLAAAALITGCKQGLAPAPDTLAAKPVNAVSKEPGEDFYDGAAGFSASLFKNACLDDIKAGLNTMLSPESAMFALGMAANGAQGETLRQMTDVLCPGCGISDVNSALLFLAEKAASQKELTFHTANSVWVRDMPGFSLKQSFLDTVNAYYGAQCFKEPFDASTAGKVNNWIKDNTNGMIPKMLDSIEESTLTMLVNATAFEGKWQNEYEDNDIDEKGTFTAYDGTEQTVPMMYSTENVYLTGKNCQAFTKSYKGGDYAFMGILPDEGTSLASLAESLSGESWNSFWNSRKSTDVEVTIPEFTFRYTKSLTDPLKKAGMELPFGSGADLGAMSDSRLLISDVLQSTFIEVGREGTRAAAATVITMTNGAIALEDVPPRICLDRPFLFAIVDTNSGIPVFLGAVNTI